MELSVKIDGRSIRGREGMTILELARENGIDIPTLCYLKELSPTGACRICVVEVEGSRTLVGSCHTPITEGMVIQTASPKVLETRKVLIELLLASHCGNCFIACSKANTCELRKIAADLEANLPRFQNPKRYYPIEDISPYIQRDLSKCILCRKCVRACNEIAKQNVFAIGYRGFDSKIVVDSDQPLNKEVCRDCGICIDHCPTGALSQPGKTSQDKKASLLLIRK
ncbi:MAG: 2Fe-2S iron-sulfur cluster-binding protein [Chloroflexota bacterium]